MGGDDMGGIVIQDGTFGVVLTTEKTYFFLENFNLYQQK
jgi:hypothetical protein